MGSAPLLAESTQILSASAMYALKILTPDISVIGDDSPFLYVVFFLVCFFFIVLNFMGFNE